MRLKSIHGLISGDAAPAYLQDPYANSFKPRWRGVPDWPSKADRATGKGGWVAERKCAPLASL